ncbi:FHA domain-containing protein [Nonomuraea sp. NPDC050556]|uniref:FHA domain-containing protein n=1 Tax=Nonomuraea sp. NPDC050556 TaxID=3364369 RepID=UPI0037A59BE6
MRRKCPRCSFVTDDDSITKCRRDHSVLVEAGTSVLRVAFANGVTVEIAPGDEVRFGRDPDWSDHAEWLQEFAKVSRRHATVGFRTGGTAWVMVESDSRNLTYVGSTPIAKGRSITLDDGCTLRFSRKLSATVTIETGDDL